MLFTQLKTIIILLKLQIGIIGLDYYLVCLDFPRYRFFNPLVNDKVYLTNPLSWLIFIFGKIVIAFGIYEMIQSFRKFKA